MEIYFDNAATTKVKDEVLNEMIQYLNVHYANPSSVYDIARENKKAINAARENVANLIQCEPKEIYFTGSGTEANNWALKGLVDANPGRSVHIITTKIEHPAILNTCEYLEKKGVEMTYLDVDENGLIRLSELESSIKENTLLISIMFANNEIGTIQPIEEIGKIAKDHGVLFHTDAVQATGQLEIDVKKLNVDMLSMSAHKIYGPKGVGALYIRNGIKIEPFIHGGGQENHKRSGTENLSGIVGFGKAALLVLQNFEHKEKIKQMRDRLIGEIMERIPDTILNGHPTERLPNNINFSFRRIEGESILLLLNSMNIYASSGSACSSGSLDPSHVLLAIGLPHEIAHGSLRLTLGDFNTDADVNAVIDALPKIVSKLREISPIK